MIRASFHDRCTVHFDASLSVSAATYYFHMSFEVINMTWHPDLNVSTSERFMRHSRLFCDRVGNRMKWICYL